MPFLDPPSVGFITKYLFENAWVLGGVALGMALVFGFICLREGRYDRLKAVAAVALLGVGILVTGSMVTTSGEHAAALTRTLVNAAVTGDVQTAYACFAPDARLSLGAPTNEGMNLAAIRTALELLKRKYDIQSNRTSRLDAYTITSREARVDLACVTDIGWEVPMPSTWMLRITRQDDGSWKIAQLTCLSVTGQRPQPEMFR